MGRLTSPGSNCLGISGRSASLILILLVSFVGKLQLFSGLN